MPDNRQTVDVFLVDIKEMSDASDSSEVLPAVMKRRAACERWKMAHRDYYLEQKRRLANRPEYNRREMYKQKKEELTLLGILPRKRGRPQMYEGSEALMMKRQRAREAARRYRLQTISQLEETNKSTMSSSSSETSD